ncbi:BON domain-containing protein [Plantactinospora sp. S1510]|uniref:BON domain-containing protein n=1 Tax=Plantactinospora alkalitolerans TaxID=2789879 RepID=A0ABS0H8Y0_9ACTN|nr:BON domain-containing protein [Plantactinospora alkalitolerans]MBF9134895.1 BON domain-containing protein [Plantactinospora alkalitolerans]
MSTATMARSDVDIQREVLAELGWDARVRASEIGVSVKSGIATLTGWVDSYAKKWAAERTAHRIRGIRAVANDIEVRLPGDAERHDPDIATAASRALEWDEFVPVEQIEVTVANGWLTLRGEVERGYQKRAAERSVRRLTGVRGVTNLIAVRPVEDISTEEIRRDIRRALARTVNVDVERIDIDVDGETVVLTGEVRSWLEREQAERVAWAAPGVVDVEIRLTLAT